MDPFSATNDQPRLPRRQAGPPIPGAPIPGRDPGPPLPGRDPGPPIPARGTFPPIPNQSAAPTPMAHLADMSGAPAPTAHFPDMSNAIKPLSTNVADLHAKLTQPRTVPPGGWESTSTLGHLWNMDGPTFDNAVVGGAKNALHAAGNWLNDSPLNLRSSQPALQMPSLGAPRVDSPNPQAPAQAASTPQLPGWAASQVHGGGGNSADYQMLGDQLVSAHPSQHLMEPLAGAPTQAPTAGPTPVYSADSRSISRAPAASQAAGQGSGDPVRDMLIKQLTQAQEGAGFARGGLFNGQSAGEYQQNGQAAMHGLAQYDRNYNESPQAQFAAQKMMLGDPQTRAVIAARYKVDPSSFNGPTSAPIGAHNIDEYMAGNPALGAALTGGKTLLDKLQAGANFDGSNVQGNPVHDAIQQHINREYGDPEAWNAETWNPNDQELSQANPIVRAGHAIFGPGLIGGGQNAAGRTAQADLLAKLGILSPEAYRNQRIQRQNDYGK